MKRIIILAASALMLASCMINFNGVTVHGYTEEGCDASQERQMPAFTEIRTSGPFNVYYIQSNESKVLIEGKEEFLDKVRTEIKDNDELCIDLEKGTYYDLVLKVTVFSPIADDISVAGSGNFVDVAGHASSEGIDYRMSGSGDLYIKAVSTRDDIDISSAGSGDVFAEQIECEDLEIAMSGSGDASVNGLNAKNLDASLAGSGSIEVIGAEIRQDAEFSISGSGSVRMDASVGHDLEVQISGSGNATLNGSCNNLEVKVGGSGDVNGDLKYNRITTNCNGSGRVRL